MKLHKAFIFSALIVLAMILAACGGGGSSSNNNTSQSAGNPGDVVKTFFTAVFTEENPNLDQYICKSQAAAAAAMKDGLAGMKSTLASTGATLDVSGLTFTVSDETADKANVTVGGNIKVTVQSVTQDIPFTDVPAIPVTKEDGAWKVCA